MDDDDYERLSPYSWHVHRTPYRDLKYARMGIPLPGRRTKTVQMHRLIMGVDGSPTPFVDHIDGNGLNNQKSNLRFATLGQNQANRRKNINSRSRYKGVTTQNGRWRARIAAHGRNYFIGVFPTEVDAASAYNAAARSLHGDFARLNTINAPTQKRAA